jgi:DNA polymerase-1
LKYEGPDADLAFELFNELDFSTLLKDITEATKLRAPQVEAATAKVEPAGRYHVITSEREADQVLKQIWQQDRFAVRAALQDREVSGVALSTEPHTASYVDLVAAQMSIEAFREVFENGLIAKCAYDFKPAIKALRRQGISIEGVAADAMIAAWLIDPNEGKYDLKTVARKHLKIELGNDQPDGERLAQEADVTLRLCEQLDGKIKPLGLESVYHQIELPLIEILADMELAGIKIDAEALAQTAKEIDAELEGLIEKIYEKAGRQFNINSPQQVGEVFEAVGIAVTKRTKKTGQISTSADVLEELAAKHELPRLILDYRELVKLKGTYVEALPKLIDSATGRIHTTFNQTGTATGRLSSSSPNLQNIPVRTDFGRRIRQAFVAEPGWMLLCADYSQIELRILAHITGDKAMTEAFQNDQDIHAHVARTVFGAKTPDEERVQRRLAKIVNFGIAYSIGAFGLAQRIGLPRREAQKVIENYYKTYSGVRHYMQETPKQARQTGYVRTLFGRIRPIPDIANKNHNLRARAEREAINAPIQGAAADIVKLAMIRVYQTLKKKGLKGRMLLQVHDELVLEVPESEVDETRRLVKSEMETACRLNVPLVVAVGVGPNWLETKGE